ncbi:hypothetical protein KSB_59500 [Ktedonobacter robiniae]|uniref:Uncharacterized protein n=1 Tax=Ktedonobacter robiniae TaxID=2778365 RepID=A0ABQ3UYV3_9CHLR|nr:hypothetical protein KSB_59500 [Ktedonobacter robiniae]
MARRQLVKGLHSPPGALQRTWGIHGSHESNVIAEQTSPPPPFRIWALTLADADPT